MSTVEFIEGDPPPSKRGARTALYMDVVRDLKDKPGVWAIVKICPTMSIAGTMAHHIREGRYKAFRPLGRFESVSRVVDGKFIVYARYVEENPS